MSDPSGIKVEAPSIIRDPVERNESDPSMVHQQFNVELPFTTQDPDRVEEIRPSSARVQFRDPVLPTVVRNESVPSMVHSQLNAEVPTSQEPDRVEETRPSSAQKQFSDPALPPLKPDSYRNKSSVSLFRNLASPSVMQYRNMPYGATIVGMMTEDELEAIMGSFAAEDSTFSKTWTRIVVEKVLSKVSGRHHVSPFSLA